jgi:hypothetical protein
MIEVPTSAVALCQFLNDNKVAIVPADTVTAAPHDEGGGTAIGTACPNCERTIPVSAPHCECGVDPIRASTSQLKIDDLEDWLLNTANQAEIERIGTALVCRIGEALRASRP